MKSFYKFFLLTAIVLLEFTTPVMATTVYRQKQPSELSDEFFTYELKVQSAVGEMEVEIHAEEKDELYVKRVAQILKEDAPRLIEYFGYVPWNKVHFLVDGVVEDRIPDRANGSATVHPRPLILLYTTPPVGMEHLVTGGDWVKNLVLHELIHILHLDQTAGFIKFLRYLMGSDGKLGGVVPSWFAEGIATWGETEFTNGGRLSRGLFSFEYHNRVLSEESCSSTVCLDNSAKHPYQGARYWYGSHFLSWLENKKSGTMACLIKKNADNLPFFLHWAFRDCVNKDYQILFDEYFSETKNKLTEEVNYFRSSRKAKGMGYVPLKKKEFLLFSNGISLKNGKLFLNMLDDKHLNYLKIIDLKQKTQENIRIEDVIESVLPSAGQDHLILKTYREFPSRNPTIWRKFSPSDKKLKAEIKWSEPSYLFELKERLIGLIFSNSSWEVWELRNGKKEKLFDLPPMTNIFNPEVIEDGEKSFISYRFHDYSQTPSHEYLRVDLDTGKEEVLFQSENSLEVMGSCGTRRVLSADGKQYSLNIQNGYVSNLPEGFKDLVFLTGDKNYTVQLFKQDPKRIYFRKKNCEEWIDQNSGIEIKRGPDSTPGPNKNYLEDKSSYPEWDHYFPHRWGVGYSGGDATSGWTLSTTLSDPGFVHSIDAAYKFYIDNSENGGSVIYQHSNDYFDLIGSYYKEFLTSNTKTTPDSVESSSIGIQKDYYFGWLGIAPGFGYSTGRTIDFISNRKYNKYYAGVTLSTDNVHYDDFLRSASLSLTVSQNETVGRLNYLGYKTRTKIKFHPSYKFDVLLQGSYEKLDKEDLGSGVAYAGGANEATRFSYHEFYGIQSNDAFGNEVYTGKLEFNYLLNEAYSGPRYLPLYIKKIYASLGAGLLKSDFIFIDSDRKFLRDKTISNIFAGISTDLDAFYLASFRLDLIVAKIMSSDISNDQNQLLFLIKAGL